MSLILEVHVVKVGSSEQRLELPLASLVVRERLGRRLQRGRLRGGHELVADAVDQLGRAREIFIRSRRPDTQVDRLVDDGAVLASLALQSGIEPEALAAAVGNRSPIGAALALLKDAKP